MSYVTQPQDYWQKSIGPYGTPGWQMAPVPGWGINAMFSAGPRRVGIGACAGCGAYGEDYDNPDLEPIEGGVPVPVLNLNTTLGQQKALNFLMGAGLTEDGSLGPKTTAAAIAFQKKYGLTADGSIGPQTIGKMQALLDAARAPKPVAPVGPTPSVTPTKTGPTPTPGPTPAPATLSTMPSTTTIAIGIMGLALAAYLLWPRGTTARK